MINPKIEHIFIQVFPVTLFIRYGKLGCNRNSCEKGNYVNPINSNRKKIRFYQLLHYNLVNLMLLNKA